MANAAGALATWRYALNAARLVFRDSGMPVPDAVFQILNGMDEFWQNPQTDTFAVLMHMSRDFFSQLKAMMPQLPPVFVDLARYRDSPKHVGVYGENEGGKNVQIRPSREKCHAVVLKGLTNISSPLSNPPLKLLVQHCTVYSTPPEARSRTRRSG